MKLLFNETVDVITSDDGSFVHILDNIWPLTAGDNVRVVYDGVERTHKVTETTTEDGTVLCFGYIPIDVGGAESAMVPYGWANVGGFESGIFFYEEGVHTIAVYKERDWLRDLFINEAKKALESKKGGSAEPVLQDKTVRMVSIDDVTITPDEGYDAIGSVTLENTLWKERLLSTGMTNMFSGCTSLTTVPLFDTSNVSSTANMFYGCTSLTTVPLFDTSNVTSIGAMFNGCTSLTTVPLFDMRKVTATASMFFGCASLTNCYLRNIKVNLQVGSGTSFGHLLTLDSLIHLIYECRDTGSQKTLTVGSANLEKLANVYVRTIPITDEMRAEDDLIDEKLPFEVCESSDEGAMLITDYALEKHWSVK